MTKETDKYDYGYMPRWDGRGKCVGTPYPAYFYEEDDLDVITTAKNDYCLSCPVRRHCLWTAVNEEEQYGLWGGLTPGERRTFKKLTEDGWEEMDIIVYLETKWKEKIIRRDKKALAKGAHM